MKQRAKVMLAVLKAVFDGEQTIARIRGHIGPIVEGEQGWLDPEQIEYVIETARKCEFLTVVGGRHPSMTITDAGWTHVIAMQKLLDGEQIE